MVGLCLIYSVEEVFELAQLLGLPACRLAHDAWHSARAFLKVIHVLKLVYQILLQDWVYRVILPPEASRPKQERVLIILIVPTVVMIPVNHAPLTAAWHVCLVAQLSFED